LRDDFVSGVSHELRTPIAQIRMFAELQESGKLRTQEEQQRAVSVINREARRLTHLVENILRFSRLRRAGYGMVVEEIDVGSMISDVLEAFRPLAASRNMTVLGRSEERVHVVANRDALNQVLVNLLDNAVKYGPAGQTIGVSAARLNGGVRIAVEDHGPGVPPKDRLRVFQPYLRLKRDLDARLPGTGIGLAVVAQLATANGGRAWVEDAAGGGACFIVELPAVTSAEASA
jgi:signal transduction histidine kinase